MKTTLITQRRKLTKGRVRSRIVGTAVRPRLSVRITNLNVVAQLIDDAAHKSLVYVSTVGQKDMATKTMTQKAEWVGQEIAVKAKTAKIDGVVFDRGWRIYHGRVKALAEAARKAGLKF